MSDLIHIGHPGVNVSAAINPVGGGIGGLSFGNDNYMGVWAGSTGGTTSGFVMAPVICTVSRGGTFISDGNVYQPGKHGMTRNLAFEIVQQTENSVVLRHIFDPATQTGIYPFRHQIEIEYSLTSDALTARLTMTNLDEHPMSFAMGLHPAFAWPLPDTQGAHQLWLDQALPSETEVYRPLEGIFQTGKTVENPLASGAWAPRKSDFEQDAYFIRHGDADQSFTMRWGEPSGRHLVFEMQGWDGFGVWSKADESPFICIEPFAGIPVTDGQDKPQLGSIKGLRTLAAGQSASATITIRLG